MATNIFEYATRNKLRFPFKGMISVEDLWQLKLEDLDNIYKTLNREVKKSQEESLLSEKNAEDERTHIMINIIKHIVSVKQDEAKVKSQEAEKAAKRQKIMSVLAEKESEALEKMSEEDLKKMLATL